MIPAIMAGIQAVDAIDKGQKAQGEARVQAYLKKANADLYAKSTERQANVIRKAGTAQTSQVTSLLSQAGVAGTSPTAQLLQDTLNQNVESDIMQTLLQGKLANIDADYQAKNINAAGNATLLGSYLQAGASLYSGYALTKQQNTV